MNLMTKKMVEYAWKQLPSDHKFVDFEQFIETARELGGFDMDANPHFYCPKDKSNPVLSPSNLKLVRVHAIGDLDDVYEPSVEITLERLS